MIDYWWFHNDEMAEVTYNKRSIVTIAKMPSGRWSVLGNLSFKTFRGEEEARSYVSNAIKKAEDRKPSRSKRTA